MRTALGKLVPEPDRANMQKFRIESPPPVG